MKRFLTLILIISSLVSSVATYVAMTHTQFFKHDPKTITAFLVLDFVLLGLMGFMLMKRIVGLGLFKRRGAGGSKLHIKMVSVFTLLAVAPGVLVVIAATGFFYFGVEAWFSNHVRTSINESLEVAQAYLDEHKQVLRADAVSMANDLEHQSFILSQSPERLSEAISAQSYLRDLPEVLVFDDSGKIMASSDLSFSLALEPVTDDMREHAKKGEAVLMVNDKGDRVRALVRLNLAQGAYLFVGRMIEPKVLAHMATTQKAVKEYKELEGNRQRLEIVIAIIFVAVAMLLLLSATWFGFNFATRLARPIEALIGAAEKVRGGDLNARVPEDQAKYNDDLEQLGRAFNRMTEKLHAQQGELISATRQMDLRRQFTEAILSGVSAGIIGLDSQRRINLLNSAAADFFAVQDLMALNMKSLKEVAPEIDEIVKNILSTASIGDGQVELHRKGQADKTLLVRVSSEHYGREVKGYVVTFDDVSDLMSAQRKAAWADIARRIAHEIKNPLTPIQLSAERLQRKYVDEIHSDPEVFTSCINTIVKHVDDIGRMVDEFSAFARMPAPVIASHDVKDICHEAIFLQENAHGDIRYTKNTPADLCMAECDHRQMTQALTNLLKNAAEAIAMREIADGQIVQGEITLTITRDNNLMKISVADNGKGLPVEERNRLTEPYVTTRSKGTGLGLAIVKKIMEDHHGRLILSDRPEGGAVVTLIWPLRQPDDDDLWNADESVSIDSRSKVRHG